MDGSCEIVPVQLAFDGMEAQERALSVLETMVIYAVCKGGCRSAGMYKIMLGAVAKV
jgi:protein tyrosine phosphatase (PTP) superfamily phosphohydrolase (DUF442 family)